MARRSLVGLALLASVVTASTAAAQAAPPAVSDSGFTATTAIMRVSLYRYADGMQAAATADMNTHLIPIFEAMKVAGNILSYSVMNNPNPSSRDDWQFGITQTFANNAALDGLGAKNAAITLKHYGTAAARTAANDARGKLRVLVSSNQINVNSYSRK
jgi:hypothetical protein